VERDVIMPPKARRRKTVVSRRQNLNRLRAAVQAFEQAEDEIVYAGPVPEEPIDLHQPTNAIDSPTPEHFTLVDEFNSPNRDASIDHQLNCPEDFSDEYSSNDSFDYGSDPEGDPEGEDRREEWDFEDEHIEEQGQPQVNDEPTEEQKLLHNLAEWVLACKIPRTHVSKLLKVLRQFPNLQFLPNDYRSLLKTVRRVEVKLVNPGFYFHFGISSGVTRSLFSSFQSFGVPSVIVKLFINIDGIPLCKSGGSQFWPILGKLSHLPKSKPFVIGVYWGNKKPADVNVYLCDFVNEAISLKQVAFVFETTRVFVTICAFICDRPALAFILCIKGHTGFSSCLKCITVGVSYKPNINKPNSSFVSFPELNAPLRTNDSFRSRVYPEHHLPEKSLLENLMYFDLVDGVLLDGMHLTDLGVMKKLLLHYIKGKYMRVRMNKANAALFSKRVEECRKFVPCEFPRKLEPLEHVGSWKATTLRMVKLYLGPVLFKNLIRNDLYDHYLLFHTSMRLLSDPSRCSQPDIIIYCQELLVKFVQECIDLFGLQFITSNVHHLIHLPLDVLRFGPLDSFAAYCFENLLQILKNLVRKSNKPLQQIVKRIGEIEVHQMLIETPDRVSPLSNPHNKGPLLNGINPSVYQYKNLFFNNTKLGISLPNNCVFLTGNRVILIENIIDFNTQILLIGRQFLKQSDFFNSPLPSHKLNCFEVWELSSLAIWPIIEVFGKAFIMPSFDVPTQLKPVSYVVSLLLPHDFIEV